MKKIKLLSAMLLLSAVAMAADYTGIQLTFNRTGTDAASVGVTVGDQDGNALSGVAATLESTSFGTLMTGSAEALTSGSVLAPANGSGYTSINTTAGAEITYLFKVTGLDASFSFDKADIDVYAMNGSGAAQSNSGNTVREFHFFVSTGNTAAVSPFASKETDTDICTVADNNGGLYHSVQTMTASAAQTATSPLYIQVTLKKVTQLGCYAGIGLVKLYSESQGTDPDPSNHEFSAEKFYTIHRNGNANAYMYQAGTEIGVGTLDVNKMCWWVLEPTSKSDCYYIKNATTGEYIQSPKDLATNVSVTMSSTPVEFQIKKDETNGASTKGFYYIASTDQDPITTVGDVTKGLNWSQDYSRVVSWWIKTGRGNSYWQIAEDEYRYVSKDVEASDYARSVQMYSVPCGSRSTSSYLKTATVEGSDILSELHYAANSAPSGHHVIYMDQKIDVRRGGTLPLTVNVVNSKGNASTYAYADWDKDGVFEVKQEITGTTTSFSVPATAELGQSRLRIRVTESGLDGAEDDVIGACYDFLVNVVEGDKSVEWTVEVNDPSRATVAAEEVGGSLKASVTPLGDAVFKGWKLMHSYFKGEIIGTNTEIEVPLTQSIRLVAILSPNTKDTPTAIGTVAQPTAEDSGIYTLQGVKVASGKGSQLKKGIYIINNKKKIIK